MQLMLLVFFFCLKVKEFLDLCLYVVKQNIASNYQKKEAAFVKAAKKLRDQIKNQRF
jgi:hypothetical protein